VCDPEEPEELNSIGVSVTINDLERYNLILLFGLRTFT